MMTIDYTRARRTMVERHIRAKGVSDPLVLAAMERVPRHLFVEEALRGQAYSDFPIPIGERQTISQPFMVATMTEALQLRGTEKVLEIGTGSGYQAAVLAQIVNRVFTIERHVALARAARRVLDATGCGNVQVKVGDGTLGWPEEAPFDAIIVTAGAPKIAQAYYDQLAIGGRLVIPVGSSESQTLMRVVRIAPDRFREEPLLDCRFVPLIGVNGWQPRES